MKTEKIAIFGAGNVGAATAFALMLKNIAAEIMLIDSNEIRCRGEILDLQDALSFCETSRIIGGTAQDARNADIIIIAAGAKQKKGQSRLALIETNKKVFDSIFNELKPINKNTIIIVVTNPVDALTLHAQKLSGLPRNQVFGTGTLLDSMRLRVLLAEKLQISDQSIQAFIIGEHGNSQVPVWSSAQAEGTPLVNFKEINQKDLNIIAQKTRNKAAEIISCKEATYYGIAACITHICESILFDQRLILPLSVYQKEFDVCLSMPVVLGRKGIEKEINIQLNKNEKVALGKSAEQIKKCL